MSSHIPVEILCEIFEHYIPPYPECPPLLGPGSPANLAQVCARWRSIALDVCWLWRAIELDLDPWRSSLSMSTIPTLCEMAKTSLARSGPLPLSIIFRCPPSVKESVLSLAFGILLAHCARWQHASITIPAALSLEERYDDEPRDMPLLRQLQIRAADGLAEHDLLFLRAPQIQTLGVRFTSHPFAVADLFASYAWKQLTTLKLDRTSVDYAAAVLPLTPALERCWLQIWQRPDNLRWPPTFSPIHLPKLKTFIIDATKVPGAKTAKEANRLLDVLVLPTLHCLAIADSFVAALSHAGPGMHAAYLDALAFLVQRWGCFTSLEKMSILHWPEKNKITRGDIMAALPSVTHLELDQMANTTAGQWRPAAEDFDCRSVEPVEW
ncbi:F-box domain-containing protein [Mycena indigotica]|uniref:F-box domain-containing protein n=1 Tax=Mycena indigotica TaxID=2126181 RepID=A0A8H6T1U4_9AGAR|nr:F-box domain-containing protein [Mycena indigotica]KAF7310108.1 F-box domain-containing protein [Mycena indigotica]